MCVCVLILACFGFLSFFQFLVLFVQKCFKNLEGGNFAHISIHFLKSQIGERDIQIWHTLSYSCHILTCSPNRTSCSAPPPDWRRSLTQGGWVNSMGPTVRPSVRSSPALQCAEAVRRGATLCGAKELFACASSM